MILRGKKKKSNKRNKIKNAKNEKKRNKRKKIKNKKKRKNEKTKVLIGVKKWIQQTTQPEYVMVTKTTETMFFFVKICFFR